jgi:hypothetical protein
MIYALTDIVVPSASDRHAPPSFESKSNIVHEYLDELIQVLANTPFIKIINIPGAFFSPSGKTVKSYCPKLILKKS